MKVENLRESMETAVLFSIVMIGINALWGIFLLPWGIIGIIFAFLNILTALLTKKAEIPYEEGRYEEAMEALKLPMILGFIFGWIVLGYYIYRISSSIEDMVIKSKLIREAVEEREFYHSPKIPER